MTIRRPRLACLALAAAVACCLSASDAGDAWGATSGRGAVVVQTAPKLAKIKLSLGGHVFRTDRRGRARVRGASSIEELKRRLKVLDTTVHPGVQARFSGWFHNLITLAIYYRVQPRFVDLVGNPIDPSRIESVTLKSGVGFLERFHGARVGWLQGRGVVPSGRHLKPQAVKHSVQQVVVDGSNVVNRGQQRFFPAHDRRAQIELLFYSARIRGRDALFGFSAGSGIRLEFPDGHTQRFAFRSGSELTLPSLPRGQYKVHLEATGLSFSRPMTLSRNQNLRLLVVTYLDIAAVLLLLALVALGLLFIGRPRLMRHIPVLGPRLSRRFKLESRL